MPWAPARACLWPGCRRRQDGPYCVVHAKLSPRNHHGVPRQTHGLGATFDRLKPLVIARDGGRCRLRLRGCTVTATTADHIVPRSRGGQTVLENLRASCGHCNSARGNGHADMQVVQSSVTSVMTGRGIGSLATRAAARTAWQPRFHAAKTHRKISTHESVVLVHGRPRRTGSESGLWRPFRPQARHAAHVAR